MLLDVDIDTTLRSASRSFRLRVRFQTAHQRVVILGPSGAGKSLTLKAIAGLLRPDQGRIRLDGCTFFDAAAGIHLPPQERRVAYLFQDYALFPHLNVRQNIAFGLSAGWRNPPRRERDERDERDERVDGWLEAFALTDVARQMPAELSGGQRQRTALARALATKPRALLLDEPFAALDASLREHMRRELDELQRRLNVPMVLISHDLQDAERFGDAVFHLRGGVIDAAAPESAAVEKA